MLFGIDPILTGEFLRALDEMGHGDAVVIADAHFTASKLAKKDLLDLPGLTSPRVLAAIRSVLVPDEFEPFQLGLMASPEPGLLAVQTELIAAAQLGDATVGTDPGTPGGCHVRLLGRQEFYDRAATAELIVRTGETRVYGNALFFKGVTPVNPVLP
ncbi:MAG: hypothetical protein LBI33_03650 [Propionibacteriaceae bacterium]|nr:hypothetical protein [Propionibacteriaceae bacterium]